MSHGQICGRVFLLVLSCLLLATESVAKAQDEDARSKVEAELQQRINEAIGRGVDSLLRQQEIDGSWKNQASGYRNGQTALSLYTLLKCDVKKDHPSLRRAVEFLRQEPPTKTYSAALQLMALCALDAEEHESLIAETAERLEGWQNGGFGYPTGKPDLSNTQYAALGLRAAASKGHRINKRTWERLIKWTLALQQAEELGGFRYHGDHKKVTGSMTSAAIAVLAICQEQLARPGKEVEPAIRRGEFWLSKHIEIERNPERMYEDDGPPEKPGGQSYYYVYGLERVGAFLQTSKFGKHDWYREGAEWLLEKQAAGGNWGGQSDTCFALLFLARATGRQPFTGKGTRAAAYTYGSDSESHAVSMRAAGRGPLRVWISSFGGDSLEYYGWRTKKGSELRVARVEYHVEDPGAEEGSLLLTTIQGQPLKTTGTERYAAKLDFAVSGNYRIFSRVFFQLPPELYEGETNEDGELDDGLRSVDSALIDVEIYQTDQDILDLYAADARLNLLRAGRNTTKTSSQRNDAHGGKHVLDGRVGSQWISAKDDPKPSISVKLPRAARGDLLLLTVACEDPGGITPKNRNANNSPAVITKVRVIVNGAKTGIDVTLESNPRRKTLVPLGRLTKVNEIHIQVLEVTPGGREDQGVGFAEIELLSEKERNGR